MRHFRSVIPIALKRFSSLLLLLLFVAFMIPTPIHSDEGGAAPVSQGEDENKNDKDDEEDKKEPPKIGNFVLPNSQQPGALVGFGGNLVEEGEVQLFCLGLKFVGRNKLTSDIVPSILWGIAEDLSLFLNVPYVPACRDEHHRSHGMADIFLQLEYAFYDVSTERYMDQATVVVNATAPTGSARLDPATGAGSPTCFLGMTYYRTYVDWTFFTSHGIMLTQSQNGYRGGNQLFYQWGVARTLPSPPGWIYACILEVDGQYSERARQNYVINPNSGGNIVLITPSLWIASRNVLFQLGISVPASQHLLGKQSKIDYGIVFNAGISFY